MTWFCPTWGRPGRLAHLAMSWDKYEGDKKLFVRISEHDPRKDEYFASDWPDGWELYLSTTRYLNDGLQEFYERHPDEASYGFIADDVVLRTHKGLERLERSCHPFYVAYPNDTIHRHRLPTHFCISAGLAKMVGWLAPPDGPKQCFIDVIWKSIGDNLGLMRYLPDVIFHHQHFLVDRAEYDSTYASVWQEDGKDMHGEPWATDKKWLEEKFMPILEDTVNTVGHFLKDGFEDELKFRREDEFWAGNHAELEIPVRGS